MASKVSKYDKSKVDAIIKELKNSAPAPIMRQLYRDLEDAKMYHIGMRDGYIVALISIEHKLERLSHTTPRGEPARHVESMKEV